jgi:hypothetical protein
MAVAVVQEFDGGTLEQYDEIIRLLGLTPGGAGVPGGLFHWVTATDGGIRVTDVWESAEQFQAFAQERIGPLAAQVGVPGQPRITVYEVHNYLTSG